MLIAQIYKEIIRTEIACQKKPAMWAWGGDLWRTAVAERGGSLIGIADEPERGELFDIILAGGSARASIRCIERVYIKVRIEQLQKAHKYLKPDGVLFFHESDIDRYQAILSAYYVMIDEWKPDVYRGGFTLWKGKRCSVPRNEQPKAES